MSRIEERFESKAREQLIEEKITVDNQINKLEAHITHVKARGVKGKHLEPRKFESMRVTLANLKARSQEIQLLLGTMPRPPRKVYTFPQIFIEIAEQELDPLTFEIIKNRAFSKCEELKTRVTKTGM